MFNALINIFYLIFFRKYLLKKIVNIEENHDVVKGNRYLIELVSCSLVHLLSIKLKTFLSDIISNILRNT